MKKRGFTLAEALVVLSIIGIVTALTLPHLTDLKPNQNKIKFLRTYDALTQTIQSLASNSKLFPVCQKKIGTEFCFSKYPLFNNSRGVNNILPETYANNNKLCMLLADEFNAQNNTCSIVVPFNINNPTYSFVTQDNIGINVRSLISSFNSSQKGNASYLTQIGINVDINNPNKCMKLSNNNCNNPNLFELSVSPDGAIYPSARDVGAFFYLKHRRDGNNRTIVDERTEQEKTFLENREVWNLYENRYFADGYEPAQ